jgi:hypothetical protein
MLDSFNKDIAITTITNVLVNELGFDMIFVISHTNIKDLIPNVIQIIRYQKYSTFKLVS